MHHLGLQIILPKFFSTINGYLDGIAVGVFFFLSSYGLVQSYLKNKENYYKKIFLVKIPALYLIQISVNLIYYLCFEINLKLTAVNILVRIFNLDIFFGFSRINAYSWFITTILLIYLAFGITLLLTKLLKKFIKSDKLFIAISFTICIFISYFLVFVFHFNSLYVRSILCFVMGLWYGLYYVKINKILQIKQVYYVIFFITISLILISFFFNLLISNEHAISLLICLLVVILS